MVVPNGPQRELLIAHCVDTEGPLHETTEATFECLDKSFGLRFEPSEATLADLKDGRGVPKELRADVIAFLSRREYKANWDEINDMLEVLFSEEWRNSLRDDFDNPYIFSWFILDIVGVTKNPRNRALGYHTIYTQYRDALTRGGLSTKRDRLYWHFHPPSYFHEAHKTSNNFSMTSEHLQVLSRRVIDYLDFPVAIRPGSHVERPDINLFLEMWIPFDFGNQGMMERPEDAKQKDLAGGRYGDWRRATDQWEIYHPDFYDYQVPGAMRRFVARCLNIDSRVRPLTRQEVEAAFERVRSGKTTLLAVTNHDEREMRPAIDEFVDLVRDVQSTSYANIPIRFVNAVEGIRAAADIPYAPATTLQTQWDQNRLSITASGEIWGPQPYFCFKTIKGEYFFENLDRSTENTWSFTFDDDFVEMQYLEAVGLATHDPSGNTTVMRISNLSESPVVETRQRNHNDWIFSPG